MKWLNRARINRFGIPQNREGCLVMLVFLAVLAAIGWRMGR